MVDSYLIHQGFDAPIQARVTTPDDPGYPSATPRDWYVMELAAKYGEDMPVNARNALTYSVVFACVRYISQSIASLGWHVYERMEDERAKKPIEDDIAWMLGMQASDEMNALEWRQVMLKDALTWGNGYSEIERDGYGRPRALFRLDPWRVCLERNSDGQLYYEISASARGGGITYLDPSDVFHLKGLGEDGLVGYSVIQMARRTIEMGLAQANFGHSFFKRGPMPGGILTMPGNVKEEERNKTRKSFQEVYGGAKNAGRVVALSGGMDFKAMSLPNHDAQWLESRSFEVEEICRFYGVPPHKVAKLDRSTNNNIEHQAIEAVQDCLLPWARRLESEADVKLYGRRMRGRRYTRINLQSLLRGDSKTQTENLQAQVNGGMRMVNEARELLDLNPVEGGDVLLVQGAMVTLERAIEGEPDPEPTPTPEPAPTPEPDDGKMPNNLRAPLLSMLEDTYSRLLRVEADKARRADKKGELRGWAEAFYRDGSQVAASVKPIIATLLAFVGDVRDAEKFAEQLAKDHNNNSASALMQGGIAAAASWQSEGEAKSARAKAQAAKVLDTLWESIKGEAK